MKSDQGNENPELTSPKRIVLMKEPEDHEDIFCPHFEVSDKRQKTCQYCNSIRKGRAKCQYISHTKHRLSQDQGVCKFELINPDGCGKLECARAHFAPNDLHIEPLPFCLDYLRNFCNAECNRPHLDWKKVEDILIDVVHSLYKSCESCLMDFKVDRENLLRAKKSRLVYMT